MSSRFERIRQSSLFKDSFWAIFGNAMGKGLSLVAGIVVARYLGKELFGQYGMVKNTLLFVGGFASFGLKYTATKYIGENIGKPQMQKLLSGIMLRLTIWFCAVVSLLIFLFSQQLADLFGAHELRIGFQLLAGSVFFNAIATTQFGVLAGYKQFKALSDNTIWTGVVIFVTSFLGVYYFDFVGALVSLIISQIFNVIINQISINKQERGVKVDEAMKQGKSREILLFSLPVACQEVLWTAVSQMYIYFVSRYAGFGEYGIITVVSQWKMLILFISGTLRNVTLSHLSSVNKDLNKQKRILKVMVSVNVVLTVVPLIVVALFSNLVVSFYGPTFQGMRNALLIGIVGAIANGIASPFIQEFMSLGKNWLCLVLQTSRDVLGLVLVILFLSRGMLFGMNASTLCVTITTVCAFIYVTALLITFVVISRREGRVAVLEKNDGA